MTLNWTPCPECGGKPRVSTCSACQGGGFTYMPTVSFNGQVVTILAQNIRPPSIYRTEGGGMGFAGNGGAGLATDIWQTVTIGRVFLGWDSVDPFLSDFVEPENGGPNQ